MGEIVFAGMGLNDENGMSLQALKELKTANNAFVELYTSVMPGFSIKRLEAICGRNLVIVSRKDLEDQNGEAMLKASQKGKVVFLVPGDPMIATTHIALRLEAKKRGIRTRIVHGASVLSAVIGLSGLHNYKFGKSATIPFPKETSTKTPYMVIVQNRKLGLHTLCLLDIKAEEKRYLSVQEGLQSLLEVEEMRGKGVVTLETLVVGVARAGSKYPVVKADSLKELLNFDFGGPPYTLVFPGKLHFMEAEALTVFADAPKDLGRVAK